MTSNIFVLIEWVIDIVSEDIQLFMKENLNRNENLLSTWRQSIALLKIISKVTSHLVFAFHRQGLIRCQIMMIDSRQSI